MPCNIGKTDRILRIVIGVVLILVAIFFSQPWAYIGIIPLVTGLVKFCPIYSLLKLNTTCESKDTPEEKKEE